MKLDKISEHVWVYPFEERRDRPNLSYIQGKKWNLAVDAGHSDEHLKEFYDALKEEGLDLPDITVITHWHWDHTLGMHAVNGLTVANEKTKRYLADLEQKIKTQGVESFLDFDQSIREEYKGGKPVIVTMPDMIFSGEMMLDLGDCMVRIFQAQAPHTDDSTLIEIPEEGVLFLGDAVCGVFPTWKKDPGLCKKLADTIKKTNVKYCVSGHWEPLSKDETLTDLVW